MTPESRLKMAESSLTRSFMKGVGKGIREGVRDPADVRGAATALKGLYRAGRSATAREPGTYLGKGAVPAISRALKGRNKSGRVQRPLQWRPSVGASSRTGFNRCGFLWLGLLGFAV